MKTLNLIISKIGVILILMICFANVSFAQTKTTTNKQTTVKQDTIVVKSLPWKEEYGVVKEKWDKLSIDNQKIMIDMSGFDADAAVAAQYDKMVKEIKEMKKGKSIKNDTIQKKK